MQGGDPDAAYRLGLMFDQGDGVPANPEEATRLYEIAASKGVAAAQLNLGAILFNANKTPTDRERARQLFEQARQSDDPEIRSKAEDNLHAYETGQ